MATHLAAANRRLQNFASAAWSKVPALPEGIRQKRDAFVECVYGRVSQISCEGVLTAQFSTLAGRKLREAKGSSEAAYVGNEVASRATIEFTKRVVSAYRIALGALAELSEGFSKVFSSTGKAVVNLLNVRVKDAGFEVKTAAKALGHTTFFTVASVAVAVAGLIFPGKAYKAVNAEQNAAQRDAIATITQQRGEIAKLKNDKTALEKEAEKVPGLQAEVARVAELEARVASLEEELAAKTAEQDDASVVSEDEAPTQPAVVLPGLVASSEDEQSKPATPAGSSEGSTSESEGSTSESERSTPESQGLEDEAEGLAPPATADDSIARRVSARRSGKQAQ